MWSVIDSPIGRLRLIAAGGALTAIEFSPFRDQDGLGKLAHRERASSDDRDGLDTLIPRERGSSDYPASPHDSYATDGRAEWDQPDDEPALLQAAAQLAQYFAGERTGFDLPLAPRGTDFQQRVWGELRKIGYGETASYGDIAHRLGLTNAASRAVGAAIGRNPIPIVVPCHRVIGANGALTGYAGGIERKRVLLDLERPTLL